MRLTPLDINKLYGEIYTRSEEHTSELQHTVISYAVFCLKKKKYTSHARRAQRLLRRQECSAHTRALRRQNESEHQSPWLFLNSKPGPVHITSINNARSSRA